MLEEELQRENQFQDIAGSRSSSDREEIVEVEETNPMEEELERERQRLKELQEQVERDKREMALNGKYIFINNFRGGGGN